MLRVHALVAIAAAFMAGVSAQPQPPALRIVWPLADAVVSGSTRVEAIIAPPQDIRSVQFFVNGRLLCTVERVPYACPWEPGDVVRGYHIRVIATLADGTRLIDNLRTKDLGYAERARVDAVLVPVIVTDRGQFVRGLKSQDFQVFEDGVAQSIAAVVSEDAPLDLVLAIDISGSMENALGDVKAAVKQLLT